MLNWLSRWGRRFWRSCCYPFQFRPFQSSRPGAVTHVLDEPPASREFPNSRVEAIRQGILVLPKDELQLDDRAPDEPLAELDLEEALMLSDEDAVDPIADAHFFEPGTLDPKERIQSPAITKENSIAKRRERSAGAEPPFDWVLEHRLAIGPLPRKVWGQDFEKQGIHTIISLCDEVEGKLPQLLSQQFRCVRVPLPNRHDRRPLTVEELKDAVDLIHWHVKKRQPVYLHCLAGIERSPLVAIAYLARYCSMDLLDAVGWLSHVHDRSCPIPAQLQVVREYLQSS